MCQTLPYGIIINYQMWPNSSQNPAKRRRHWSQMFNTVRQIWQIWVSESPYAYTSSTAQNGVPSSRGGLDRQARHRPGVPGCGGHCGSNSARSRPIDGAGRSQSIDTVFLDCIPMHEYVPCQITRILPLKNQQYLIAALHVFYEVSRNINLKCHYF